MPRGETGGPNPTAPGGRPATQAGHRSPYAEREGHDLTRSVRATIRQTALFLAEQQVQHPAAADVRPGAAAVVEDGGVGAAGVFQRVGEDGHVLESPFVVDAAGDGRD